MANKLEKAGIEQIIKHSVKGKYYKNVQTKGLKKIWHAELKNKSRKFLTSTCRLRFDYEYFSSHLYKMKIVKNKRCSCANFEDNA